MALPDKLTLSEAEYLAMERNSEIKHEYVSGNVVAMTGASLEHNTIVGNVVTALNNQLADRPCLLTPRDLRVKIHSPKLTYRYPDIVVVCDSPQMEGKNPGSLLNPTVLIEVISPSTTQVDRNEKLSEYRQIVSLQAYLLISEDTPRIERYLRQDAQNWLYSEVAGLNSSIELAPIGCTLALSQAYKKSKRFEMEPYVEVFFILFLLIIVFIASNLMLFFFASLMIGQGSHLVGDYLLAGYFNVLLSLVASPFIASFLYRRLQKQGLKQ